MESEVFIERRYCGPSLSGNGGYVCGRIASFLSGTVSVRLLTPPPLETTMHIEKDAGKVRLLDGDRLIGEGRSGSLDLVLPEPVSFEEAVTASGGYAGFRSHSFPRCFVCGPERAEGDGLRIFAGRTKDGKKVASPWVVDPGLAREGRVPEAFVWAALDCPGAFAVGFAEKGMTFVLGELTARIDRPVRPGERCVVMGWPLEVSGRRRMAGTAVFTDTGLCVGLARAVWVEVPESLFPPENPA